MACDMYQLLYESKLNYSSSPSSYFRVLFVKLHRRKNKNNKVLIQLFTVVVYQPNPQPRGPGDHSSYGFYPLTCSAWVTLPVVLDSS